MRLQTGHEEKECTDLFKTIEDTDYEDSLLMDDIVESWKLWNPLLSSLSSSLVRKPYVENMPRCSYFCQCSRCCHIGHYCIYAEKNMRASFLAAAYSAKTVSLSFTVSQAIMCLSLIHIC